MSPGVKVYWERRLLQGNSSIASTRPWFFDLIGCFGSG